MDENPPRMPAIPADAPNWRKRILSRAIAMIVGGIAGWLLSPQELDYPVVALLVAIAATACGAALGYAACSLATFEQQATRFSIRDLLLTTMIVAVLAAWWADRVSLIHRHNEDLARIIHDRFDTRGSFERDG